MIYTWNNSDRLDLVLRLFSHFSDRICHGVRLSDFNRPIRTFYLTMALRQELSSFDGFSCFFLNYGEFFHTLPSILLSIGAPVPAAIFHCAADALGFNIPATDTGRKEMLDTMPEYLAEVFDQSNCALRAFREDLAGWAYEYVSKHQGDFPAEILNLDPKSTASLPSNIPHPFRDKPYIFRPSGTLIYEEPSNPYETVKVYLDIHPEFIGIKSYISEHGPDGGSSWHGLFLDVPNIRKLQKAVTMDLAFFFTQYYQKNANMGLIGLSQYLTERKINFISKRAF